MASMNEQIVREYFEMLGFFVIQPNKYQVAARKKTADEEIDMLICRPEGKAGALPDHGLWGAEELHEVDKALVSVRGWHTDRFFPAVLDSLNDRDVNGVVTFRNMLQELAADIDVKNNYEKSDVLQMLRILKNYDLLREPQMELFTRRRKGSKS